MDERGNAPSASGIGRLEICPGSWNLEKKFPDFDSAMATEGTLRHELIADEELVVSSLEPERRFVVERARVLTDKARKDAGFTDQSVIRKEERYWLLNEAGARVLSGKFDYAEYEGETGLIIDYKTLGGYQVNAYDNLQLRAYAVLLAEEHNLTCVYICLIQPLGVEAYSIDMLNTPDIRGVKLKLLSILKDALNPSAPRVPHPDACKWCKALVHCPEARQVMDRIVEVDLDKLEDPFEIERLIGVAQIASKFAERLTKWVKEKLKENDNYLPNYKLRRTGTVKSIKDIPKAIRILMDKLNVTDKDLSQYLKITLSDITKLYENKTGDKKGSRKAVEELLSEVIIAKEKSPSLQKSK
jgi:hypothetical protein